MGVTVSVTDTRKEDHAGSCTEQVVTQVWSPRQGPSGCCAKIRLWGKQKKEPGERSTCLDQRADSGGAGSGYPCRES